MSALKNTPLVEYHIELGAKMVPHAGWNMPQQYPEGIIAEHRHTRSACSIFDNCHMGEFRLAGPGAVAFADRLTARPLSDLPVGALPLQSAAQRIRRCDRRHHRLPHGGR